jgi:hypothetical protein
MALLGLAGAPHDQTLFAEIDLGDIAQGGQKQHAFQLPNDSGAFVEAAVIETNCSCASLDVDHIVLRLMSSLSAADHKRATQPKTSPLRSLACLQ